MAMTQDKGVGIFLALVAAGIQALHFVSGFVPSRQSFAYHVMVVGFGVVMLAMAVFVWKVDDWQEAAEKRRSLLHSTWLDAMVTVHSVRATRRFSGHSPELELDLSVVVEGLPAQRCTVRREISFLAAPRIVLGAACPAKVDPNQHSNFFVQAWD